MRISRKNIIKHELIGLDVEIVNSPDPSQTGIKGTVVDETKNLIVIKTGKDLKKIEKKYRTFEFKLPSGERVRVNGNKIVSRPEDRVKIWP